MEKIKQLIKTDIADVESKIQAIASGLGYQNLDEISDADAGVIAEEVEKNNGGLAVTESQKPAPITKNGSNKKPSKATQPLQTQPVNPDMKKVITDLVQGTERLYQTTDSFCEKLTADKSKQIVERLRQVNPDILASVVDELQIEADNTEKFCSDLEQMLREAYASF